jgi:hypothetical protein
LLLLVMLFLLFKLSLEATQSSDLIFLLVFFLRLAGSSADVHGVGEEEMVAAIRVEVSNPRSRLGLLLRLLLLLLLLL